MSTTSSPETPAQERAQEAAERAEWDRLSAILFAHWNAVEPNAHHCFCGSLEDLRAAVAELTDRELEDQEPEP